MSLVAPSSFLRRVLVADALISAAAGAAMALGAGLLAPLLGLPAPLLVGAGVVLFPWAAALLWLVRKRAVPVAAVWAVIVLNAAWVGESAWVALGGTVRPNSFGLAFIALQAAMVAVLADLEFIGLRRSLAVRYRAPGESPA